ncbi:thioredoxin family protein [Halalkaliarchaeum sp. AArc-GB]|uniref:thioredoxin family protein n=1 Tax=Halalkaliarchaeum sp. AArc-GB TaxID=3074078 RepID=UPI00285DDAE7|nr:thioredoxin family protein [Halalkaliarchaeum sp. AArc-GB]MDR5671551.1 thioredoxin family protein [Halalkaliarchaeum sp. AArc-GB]
MNPGESQSSNGETPPTLETMEPGSDWDPASHADVVEMLSTEGLAFKVWGGDWCGDCRRQLPALGAALQAADVPPERIEQYSVEKTEDGKKTGPRMSEYGVELIPTVVVERDGTELARFVESGEKPIPEALSAQLADEISGRS